ncbi:TPA: hypothetical protein ACJIWU_001870 [Enterobacter chengduensis]|uniref:hypothetical protein n=1 Tax=Enterobacter cloacae complex TaxID=354276 RepID=UPI00049F402D|nr:MULTISPECIES: hypothetical protein [Enterobacter cloacae complex]KDF49729.1 hypothetical protein AE07_01114 [Enterobacter cloacae BWH 43]GJL41726.1 hypothetical protein TUM17577_29350 [Enterobacter asburiae]MBN9877866.1 hypothetical protein [Enterobacter chengduensis]MBT1933010.1 hypothetical protein [Enterobacter chengduensis]MBT1961489.1 hypothetical protein [Enterobacter chengduensis]
MYFIRLMLKGCTVLILLASIIWAFKEPVIKTADWDQGNNALAKIECHVMTDL